MSEKVMRKGDPLKYVAIIAIAVVLLACIAAGVGVSIVLIDAIPFHSIFPH